MSARITRDCRVPYELARNKLTKFVLLQVLQSLRPSVLRTADKFTVSGRNLMAALNLFSFFVFCFFFQYIFPTSARTRTAL